jgi:chaperonin GroES
MIGEKLPVVSCQLSVKDRRRDCFLLATDNWQHLGPFQERYIMANLRPLGDKVLVKRVEAESKTKSGIVLPDTAKEKPKRGKVLSVGEGKRLDNGERAPVNVKKGDEVIFASYAGTEIKLDGEELMIMSEDDILAIVE